MAHSLAILGTASDVGKSVVVTALCRILANRGIDVAPFKAQNMSNNSHVTLDGGEMGRAQVVQAQAARLEPVTDMNPVLLKPSSDTGAQVVLHGKHIGNALAKDYFADTESLFRAAREALDRLRASHDMIILEGAGSCAEVNLRTRDFVNIRMAQAADAPVVLVGDIDRGGIFAQLIGTLECLPTDDRERIKGFIINRFRGDPALFDDGIDYIERRTGLPVLGLVPYFRHIEIESEDGLPLDIVIDPAAGPLPGRINIGVIRLPHISNFTDFNALAREPVVNLHYLARPRSLNGYDILLLPGSKNVRSDLDWMRNTGWDEKIREYHARGGEIGGICGGYQMLGRRILDPHGVEGDPGHTEALNLLQVESTLAREKTLARTVATWNRTGHRVAGYEIHMGQTHALETRRPTLTVITRNDQATDDQDGHHSADDRVWGTYLHGLFDDIDFRHDFLKRLKPDLAQALDTETAESVAAFRDRQYNLLAQHFEQHLDMDKIMELLQP